MGMEVFIFPIMRRLPQGMEGTYIRLMSILKTHLSLMQTMRFMMDYPYHMKWKVVNGYLDPRLTQMLLQRLREITDTMEKLLIMREPSGFGIDIIAFSPEQIKSVDNTNPTSDPDIRYSINEPTMTELVDKYGAIKPGEKQHRDYKVAKKTSKTQYVSHFARTMAESKVLPEQEVSTLEKLILSGKVSHEVVTDKESLKFAENMLKGDGWEYSVNRWQSVANGDKIADKKRYRTRTNDI